MEQVIPGFRHFKTQFSQPNRRVISFSPILVYQRNIPLWKNQIGGFLGPKIVFIEIKGTAIIFRRIKEDWVEPFGKKEAIRRPALSSGAVKSAGFSATVPATIAGRKSSHYDVQGFLHTRQFLR